MAREMVDTQRIDSNGITNPTYTTIGADGVEFANTGTEIVIIKAPTAADITFVTDATVDGGLSIEDKEVSLSADDEYMISNLSKKYFNTIDGTVMINSSETDTEIIILKT
ncbi:MAG: hypothetical protein ACOCRU_02755 [bacterium]